MPTEPAYGWGVQRNEATTGKPFLLSCMFGTREQAIVHILEVYGELPNRKAALRRALRQEGFRAVRVALRPLGTEGVES